MMAQRGRCHVQMALDLANGSTAVAALDDEAEDPEPHRMAEGAELLGVVFQLGGHDVASNKLEIARKCYFEYLGNMET